METLFPWGLLHVLRSLSGPRTACHLTQEEAAGSPAPCAGRCPKFPVSFGLPGVWEVGITAPFSMVPVATPTGYRALMGGWPLGMHIMSFNFSTHWRLADILSPRGRSRVSGVHPPLVFVAEDAPPPPPGLLLQLCDPAKSSALSKAVRLQVAAFQPTWSPPSRPSPWPEAQEVWLPAGLSWVSLVNSPSSSPEWSEEGTQPGE